MSEQQNKPWYEAFFEGDYLYLYQGQGSVTEDRTRQQVDFVEQVLGMPKGSRLLDLCCGWGRHAIPLAQRGYAVTGQDLSESHVRLAGERASEAAVQAVFVRGDMRSIEGDAVYDAVINLFTAFGYFETDADDQKVLNEVARALKPGGEFLIDLVNREYLMRHFESKDWEVLQDGVLVTYERTFDFITSHNSVRILFHETNGNRRETGHSARIYSLTELITMLKAANLVFRQVWGGFDGSPYGLDSRRMIVLAQKAS